MILPDSSVWIALLRGLDTEPVRKLCSAQAEIILGDLILFEILQGARDDKHAWSQPSRFLSASVRERMAERTTTASTAADLPGTGTPVANAAAQVAAQLDALWS